MGHAGCLKLDQPSRACSRLEMLIRPQLPVHLLSGRLRTTPEGGWLGAGGEGAGQLTYSWAMQAASGLTSLADFAATPRVPVPVHPGGAAGQPGQLHLHLQRGLLRQQPGAWAGAAWG